MEEVIAALPKDGRQIGVVLLKDLLGHMFLSAIDQVEDNFARAESVRPLFHFKCVVKLGLAHVQQLRGALVVLEGHRVGNLVLLGVLAGFDDVSEVVVKNF